MVTQRLHIVWKKFGKDVKVHREERGLGLREAARALHVAAATWCRIEQGKPVDAAVFLWVAAWIGKEASLYVRQRK